MKGNRTRPLPLRRSQYQIFPAHPADRHEAQKASISQHGVQNPTTWDDQGNLLDGWERETICEELDITCPREVRHFSSESEKFQFILAVNAHRRPSLNQKQKREVIEAYLRGDPGVADNTLGQTLGVSKNTVLTVRRRLEASRQIPKVKKTKGKDGKLRPVKYTKRIITNTPKEFEKAQEIVKDLPDNCAGKMLDIITASRRAKKHKKQEVRRGQIVPTLPSDGIRLYHCPFQMLEQAADLTPGSTHLFLTDIPYEQQFLPQVDALARMAQRLLIEGGLLVMYYGHAYLDRVMSSLGKQLTYCWTLASVWDGDGNVFHPFQVVSRWKPILVYSKGRWRRRERWPDVIRVNSKEKNWHAWQQPLEEVERLVSYFSHPGDLVVDACGGGFTTAEACLRLSRRCVSCDISRACFENGLRRLEEARQRMQSKTGA